MTPVEVMSIAICLFAGIVLVLIWKRTSFKGAPVWPVVGVLPSVLIHFEDFYNWLTRLAILNGGTFRLHGPWKSKIFTADPANIEYVLRTRYHNFGKGEHFKDVLQDFLDGSLVGEDGERFRLLNKSAATVLLSTAFCNSVATTLPAVVHQKLLPVFSHACDKGTIIDLQNVFLRLAYDNMCIFGVGVDPGSLSSDLHSVPFLEAFEDALRWVVFRMCMPTLCWKLLRYFNIGPERRFREARDFVYGFLIEELYPRLRAQLDVHDDGSPRSEIASAIIRLERESGRIFSEKKTLSLLISIILAGKENITAGLSWFFWLVAQHPHVEASILAELRGILDQRETQNHDAHGDPRPFNFEEVKQMHYLHAAVTESLRLYPPTPMDITEAEQDDVLPDGTPVEKGAQVVYLMYSSARLESVWGEDCLAFKPERWFKDGTGRFVRESEFKFSVFNGGPRRCTGRQFAYWQMKWAAASILIRHRIKIVDKHSVLPKFGMGLLMKHGLPATIHPRKMKDAYGIIRK